MSTPEIDWLLLSRYGLMVTLCELIPVPLVDAAVANLLRRRMVRRIAREYGQELDADTVALLGNAPGGGCLGMVLAVVLWPIKKLFKTFFFLLGAKGLADLFSDVVHRGLLLHEAFEQGWLPDEPERVRTAMDNAMSKVDTRLIERKLMGAFRDGRAELNQVVHATTQQLRTDSAAARAEELADHLEADGLPEEGERMSAALAAALEGTGTAPELVRWFQEEMKA